MARIRSIKPEFFTDEKMGRLSHEARLLFIGLWCFADDEGRMGACEKVIAGQIFPFQEDSTSTRRALDELSTAGRIRLYEVNGDKYLSITNFTKHQKIDRPSKSRFPRPPEPKVDEASSSPQRTLDADLGSRIVGSRISRAKTPREIDGSNPRFKPLIEKLVILFEKSRGGKYRFEPKDAKAIQRLLAFGDSDEEILRRWERSLKCRYPQCSSLLELANNWNSYTTPVEESEWTKVQSSEALDDCGHTTAIGEKP